MATTLVYWALGFRVGIMENKMETIKILYMDYMWIIESKMETTI